MERWEELRRQAERTRAAVTPDDLAALDAELTDIASAVCAAATPEEADADLDRLLGFVELLAYLSFRDGETLPERLRRVLRKYERLDDPRTRRVAFDDIRRRAFPAEH